MDQAKTVTAEFALKQYTLTVSKTGNGGGTVSADYGSIDCGSTCSDDYNYNTKVTLSATPSTGSSFIGWSGGVCSGTGACEVTVDQAKKVTAEFTLKQYALTVDKTGNGEGTISADSGSIDCGSTCSDDYDYNTKVTLSATPSTGSSFIGWSGGVCSGTGACEVTVDQAKKVTAEFTLKQYALTVDKTGNGEGTISADSGSIDCGSTCSDDYDYNTKVTLSATPETGSSFTGWSGGVCSGIGACEVTVDQAKKSDRRVHFEAVRPDRG